MRALGASPNRPCRTTWVTGAGPVTLVNEPTLIVCASAGRAQPRTRASTAAARVPDLVAGNMAFFLSGAMAGGRCGSHVSQHGVATALGCVAAEWLATRNRTWRTPPRQHTQARCHCRRGGRHANCSPNGPPVSLEILEAYYSSQNSTRDRCPR